MNISQSSSYKAIFFNTYMQQMAGYRATAKRRMSRCYLSVTVTRGRDLNDNATEQDIRLTTGVTLFGHFAKYSHRELN